MDRINKSQKTRRTANQRCLDRFFVCNLSYNNIQSFCTWLNIVISYMKNERTISLTIVKILNWDNSKSSDDFIFSFLSLSSGAHIMTKRIRGTITYNEVEFNCCLQISYVPSQHQMLIKLMQTHLNKQSSQLLAQFTVNLDYLGKKRVQFLPFGSSRKVLKLEVGHQTFQSNNQQPIDRESRLNEQFIRQKEEYLRRASSSLLKRPSNIKKACSLKAIGLLQQIQQLKQSHNLYIKRKFNDYGTDQQNSEKQMRQHHINTHNKRKSELETSRQSSRSQRHQLQIKNLQIVPCESQYYETLPATRTQLRNQPQNRSQPKKNCSKLQYY